MEEKTKYKATGKILTIRDLSYTAAAHEIERFRKNYLECTISWLIQKPTEPIDVDEKLIAYAEKSECFMEFLLNGYIELVESAYDKWIAECPYNTITVSNLTSDRYVEWAKKMPRD